MTLIDVFGEKRLGSVEFWEVLTTCFFAELEKIENQKRDIELRIRDL